MPATLPHIIDQHAEEAAFLWLLRSYAVHAPHYRLKDLTKLDNRIAAHLDGLRIASDDGWRLCEDALKIGEAGEVFAAGVSALESQDPYKISAVISAASLSIEAAQGLISALGWTEAAKLAGSVKHFLVVESAFPQLLGIATCAMHRVNPGAILDTLLRNEHAPLFLRARALRTIGEIKRQDLYYELHYCFNAEQPEIRFWSAWSAVLLGEREAALEVLKAFAQTDPGWFRAGLPVLFRALPVASANVLLSCLAQSSVRRRDLVAAAGMVGDPLYVAWLIQVMEIPKLARVAGESFSFITGADLAYADLDRNKPEGFEAGPTENPADADVGMDQDENLPWPDPQKIQAWWQERANSFQPGVRYLLGAPITLAQCQKVLREGFQRQRAAAALELALMNKDEALFEVRAPGWRQQRLLQNRP